MKKLLYLLFPITLCVAAVSLSAQPPLSSVGESRVPTVAAPAVVESGEPFETPPIEDAADEIVATEPVPPEESGPPEESEPVETISFSEIVSEPVAATESGEAVPLRPAAVPAVPEADLEPIPVLRREPRKVAIGIVRDGPSWLLGGLTQSVKTEIRAIAGREVAVTFKESPSFDAGWDLKRMRPALQSAIDDPGVDIVLAMGVLVTQEAASLDLDLNKPVVGGLILDTDIANLPPCEGDVCLKRNLTFIVSSLRVQNDLEAFMKMVPFTKLHVVGDSILLKGTKNFGGSFGRIGTKMGFSAVFVTADDSAEDVLARLGPGTEAVYLTPPLRMSRAETQILIDGIKERKIPSFSMRGLPDVEKGVLAGIAPRTTQQLGRRIALNIQQIIAGDSPASIPVALTLKTQFVVNALTAAAIGYSPSFETLMTAEFLHRDALDKGEPLDLQEAMEVAALQNIDLAIVEADVRISKQVRNRAFSVMLPQVEGDTRYELYDKDRAQASFGQLPEWATTIGFGVRQILFDDATFSRWRSSKRAYRQRQYEEDNVRLDIVELAAKRYLDILSAKAIQRIETENLRLTRSNLDIARTRYRVGAAGREEVYRWEAQLSRNKSALLVAESDVESARVALNQTLGTDQDRLWKARDIVLADDDSYFLDNRLEKIISNTATLDVFRRFAVEDAFENSPALMAVGEAIDAQRIRFNQLKRKFVVPTFDGVFDFDHAMNRHRVTPPGTTADEDLFLPDREDWFLGARASIPLFEGGGRVFDVYRARAGLDKLESTRERARQLIEQSTQTSIYTLESSQPNIRLSRQAADAAHKNLDIVTDKYAQGLVSIIDLLDAQNQALTEDRAAALAVYDYLKNLYGFQRAISWFQEFKTPEEKDEWLARLDVFMKQHGKNP